jgi:DNA-binding NarL/FixJ family response regulator
MRILVMSCDSSQRGAIERAAAAQQVDAVLVSRALAVARVVSSRRFDAVVLDFSCSGIDVLSLVRKVREAHPELPIIAINVCGSAKERMETLRAGADDCVGEPLSADELLMRVRVISERAARPRSAKVSGRKLERYGLTAAEARLASMLMGGLALAQIASRLGVSRNTLRSQLHHIFRKTGTRRQAELVSRLLANGPEGTGPPGSH